MKVGVVILNFNGWQDTIACAESVLASTYAPSWVIIVDNASTNDSLRWIRHWTQGNMEFALQELGAPASSPKPLKLVERTGDECLAAPIGSLVLVRSADNRGYAAGNNIGIRMLLQWGADAVWILNNDTVVDKNALLAMKNRLFSKPRPGLCGSRVQYMGTDRVQCCGGGKTNLWTGLSTLSGYGFPIPRALLSSAETIEKSINFIYGASVMASREFIQTVGLLDERYFLYCEEQDWAYSARGAFDLAYAQDAIVIHKEGCSTGFSYRKISPMALWYLTKSRVLLTAKHNPWALPTVFTSIIFAALRMMWRRLIVKTVNFTKHV